MIEDNNQYCKYGISFSWKHAGVYIYKNTLKALGNPEYVRFLFDEKKKHLALQVCMMQDSGSIKVSRNNDVYTEITSLIMLRLIWKMCNWDKKNTLRCFGKLYSKSQVVDFDLNDVELVEDI